LFRKNGATKNWRGFIDKTEANNIIAKSRENILGTCQKCWMKTIFPDSHRAKKADQSKTKSCHPTSMQRPKQLLSTPKHRQIHNKSEIICNLLPHWWLPSSKENNRVGKTGNRYVTLWQEMELITMSLVEECVAACPHNKDYKKTTKDVTQLKILFSLNKTMGLGS
jgi:hypothetical protein